MNHVININTILPPHHGTMIINISGSCHHINPALRLSQRGCTVGYNELDFFKEN
jgi:hypothetical protein